MKLGVIGLGKMGLGLARNLVRNGYKVVGFDISKDNLKQAQEHNIETIKTIKEFLSKLDDRKIVFLLIPAGQAVDDTIQSLIPYLKRRDILVDCGNSNYKDTIRRYEYLKGEGIDYLDCGTSGGPSGALNGACTMIGGNKEVYDELKEIFDAISLKDGSLYIGKSGSGHFVKMVHNGIEYGMMQAIAEGYEIMYHSDFDIDLEKVSVLFNNGSVIRSWLIELMADVMKKDKDLKDIKGVMNASGEAKWTVETALDFEVPAPVIALSLMMRNRSLKEDTYSGKVIASLRNQFGGHDIVHK